MRCAMQAEQWRTLDSVVQHGLAGILRAASTGALQPASTSAPSYVTIAIVPAGARPPQLADFTARLVAALQVN